MRSRLLVRNSSSSESAACGQTLWNWLSCSVYFALLFGFLTCSTLERTALGEEEKSAASEGKADSEKSHGDGHGSSDSQAAGHGHDDLDNTHKDGSKGLESPDSIGTDKTLFSVVVFLLLLAGLYFLAWGPIMEGLSKREASINTLIANAEKASADAASKLREYELKLEVAAQEAQSMLSQARKDAESAGQKIIGEAQAEAVRQKEQALADIDSAKRVALSELSSKSTELAFTLAKRIVGRELRTEDHQQLVADVLRQFPNQN